MYDAKTIRAFVAGARKIRPTSGRILEANGRISLRLEGEDSSIELGELEECETRARSILCDPRDVLKALTLGAKLRRVELELVGPPTDDPPNELQIVGNGMLCGAFRLGEPEPFERTLPDGASFRSGAWIGCVENVARSAEKERGGFHRLDTVWIEPHRIFATDGHRLSVTSRPEDVPAPAETLAIALDWIDAVGAIAKRKEISAPRVRLSAREADARFVELPIRIATAPRDAEPPTIDVVYEPTTGDKANEIGRIRSTPELLEALKLAEACVKANVQHSVQVTLNGRLEIGNALKGAHRRSESFNCGTATEGECSFLVNPKYLREALESMGGDESASLWIGKDRAHGPGPVRFAGAAADVLVMPMMP